MYTTSRYASIKTREAAKAMALVAGEPFVCRGKKTIQQLATLARKSGEEHIHILEEKNDGPGKLAKIEVDALGRWKWVGEKATDNADHDSTDSDAAEDDKHENKN